MQEKKPYVERAAELKAEFKKAVEDKQEGEEEAGEKQEEEANQEEEEVCEIFLRSSIDHY